MKTMESKASATEMSPLEHYVRTNMYVKMDVEWAAIISGQKVSGQIYEENGSQKEFLTPKIEAMLLMAKYYEMKYGVKIIVVSSTEDLEKIKELVDECEKSPIPCRFGFVLPSNQTLLDAKPWDKGQPFSELEDESCLSLNEGHVCPAIYEKLYDGRSSIITLDTSGGKSVGNSNHRNIIAKIAGDSIPIFNNSAILQRSRLGCRDMSILILKDALRIQDLIDQFGFSAPYKHSAEFDLLPDALLKYVETERPLKETKRLGAILRSSPDKPSTTLKDYREKNLGEIRLRDNQIIVAQNVKSLNANELMVGRVIAVLEHYKVDPTQDAVETFIKTEISARLKEFPSLPEDQALPTWSHMPAWSHLLRERESPDNRQYPYVHSVATGLKSVDKFKRDRALSSINPFTEQVSRFVTKAINFHFDRQVMQLCRMVKILNSEVGCKGMYGKAVITEADVTNVVNEINVWLKTSDLCAGDFMKYFANEVSPGHNEDEGIKEIRGKIRTAVLSKLMDSGQENDPIREFIIEKFPEQYYLSNKRDLPDKVKSCGRVYDRGNVSPRVVNVVNAIGKEIYERTVVNSIAKLADDEAVRVACATIRCDSRSEHLPDIETYALRKSFRACIKSSLFERWSGGDAKEFNPDDGDRNISSFYGHDERECKYGFEFLSSSDARNIRREGIVDSDIMDLKNCLSIASSTVGHEDVAEMLSEVINKRISEQPSAETSIARNLTTQEVLPGVVVSKSSKNLLSDCQTMTGQNKLGIAK